MMFISWKTFLRRFFVLLCIFSILGVGLVIFASYEDTLFNTRAQDLPTYVKVITYTAQHSDSWISSVGSTIWGGTLEKQYTGQAQAVPVLLYHGIVTESDTENVLVNNFREQMFALKEAGWQTITLEQFYQFTQGEIQLPEKSFMITFDDGRKDSYYPVDPILNALNYTAVMFVITEHSLLEESSNYYLSQKNLEDMLKSGRWEIQAHARFGHHISLLDSSGKQGPFYTNRLWLPEKLREETVQEYSERIQEDLSGAKEDLRKIGIEAMAFAVPYSEVGLGNADFPEANTILVSAVKQYYKIAFVQASNDYSFIYPNSHIFLVKRIEPKPEWDASKLLAVLAAGEPKSLPYLDNLEKDQGWIRMWGMAELHNGLIMTSPSDATESFIYLDGTYLWKDYHIDTQIDLKSGNVFSILGYLQDDSNYVSCTFSGQNVKLEQIIDGQKVVIVQENTIRNMQGMHHVEMGIHGDFVFCSFDSEMLIHAAMSNDLTHGGIGFKIWSPEPGASEVVVNSIRVSLLQ